MTIERFDYTHIQLRFYLILVHGVFTIRALQVLVYILLNIILGIDIDIIF